MVKWMFCLRANNVSRIGKALIDSQVSHHLMAEELSCDVVYSDIMLSKGRPESLDTFNGNIECGTFDQHCGSPDQIQNLVVIGAETTLMSLFFLVRFTFFFSHGF
jgi:hypothetical protein